ncbi:MAG: nitrogen regulatory protein [Chthoniobacteraceae bacterium]|nr:nitrogen regulatory protein [Chthoniobacteraceae bacterium]
MLSAARVEAFALFGLHVAGIKAVVAFHAANSKLHKSKRMKKIEAIIKPFKLEEVKEALAVLGIDGMTVSEVKEFGCRKGILDMLRGNGLRIEFLPKIKLEVVVRADLVDQAIAAVIQAAGTGEGSVFISPVDGALRIRTNESGEGAV